MAAERMNALTLWRNEGDNWLAQRMELLERFPGLRKPGNKRSNGKPAAKLLGQMKLDQLPADLPDEVRALWTFLVCAAGAWPYLAVVAGRITTFQDDGHYKPWDVAISEIAAWYGHTERTVSETLNRYFEAASNVPSVHQVWRRVQPTRQDKYRWTLVPHPKAYYAKLQHRQAEAKRQREHQRSQVIEPGAVAAVSLPQTEAAEQERVAEALNAQMRAATARRDAAHEMVLQMQRRSGGVSTPEIEAAQQERTAAAAELRQLGEQAEQLPAQLRLRLMKEWPKLKTANRHDSPNIRIDPPARPSMVPASALVAETFAELKNRVSRAS